MHYDGIMSHFISRWLVLTIAAGVMVALLPGMHAIGDPPILGIGAFALFMALINASIKPIVHAIALPFSILSFGLIALIINWLFMQLASWLAMSLFDVGVVIDGFVVVRHRFADHVDRIHHRRRHYRRHVRGLISTCGIPADNADSKEPRGHNGGEALAVCPYTVCSYSM